ncbi:DUF4157 domain-containing protein [Pleionea sp. CnH1-48]|uniref:eCIS core domain-containing protein n=1 Tax=Pleionea sp. CnH1-48 TaxID=2954494 RepID=UPI002096AA2E|nr:DUF4157 domain-containing protein [Pleionea sp. CnH1-48]MCO7223279.1 DUF4157 domain-containing protein [Pleionea sp. CnH1-48]
MRESKQKSSQDEEKSRIKQPLRQAKGVKSSSIGQDDGELESMVNKSHRVNKTAQLQNIANGTSQANTSEPGSHKVNGLPTQLKSNIEQLSGYSMDDVKVHYNSFKPIQLQAHAYAQGNDIHIAPGQDKHLPHEAWHVVQQKQGRVNPTMQMKNNVALNDDKHLEDEADTMGAKAMSLTTTATSATPLKTATPPHTTQAVQRVKATIIEEMPSNVKDAVNFLNDLHDLSSLTMYADIVRMQIDVIEQSDYKDHCSGLIATIKSKLPQPKKPVSPLKEKNIHSIWVQGEYRDNVELQDAIDTRKKTQAKGWQNLIWVYETAKKKNEDFEVVDNMVGRRIEVRGFRMFEVDFSRTMAAWKDKPPWVSKFLPLLQIMLAKKSFVAMSDIMRMIILFYKGGLYQDVKIQFKTNSLQFFNEPLVNTDVLQLADGGSNKENWAMIANAGCKMIEEIMIKTLSQFPSASKIASMPINYSNKGQYSKAHVHLHEAKGPWNKIEAKSKFTDNMKEVNPSLDIENPRAKNSWSDTDGVKFDWQSEPTQEVPLDANAMDRPGRTFGAMAAEIERNINQRERTGQLSRLQADELRNEFRPHVERLIMESMDAIQHQPHNVDRIMAQGIQIMNNLIDRYIR